MSLLIPQRFNGPATSGNGGYVAGRLASYLPVDATVTVTLRRPPPLETEMTVDVSDGAVRLLDGDALVAEGVAVDPSTTGDAVAAVDVTTAREAMSRFDGAHDHPFPTCFVCGTARTDGLGLHAGPPAGGADGSTAAVFEPRTDLLDGPAGGGPALIGAEFVWCALDCPGGWSIGLPGRPAVLGRMTARVTGLPAVGETCVVVGHLDRWEGRKAFTRTSLYAGDGREIGRAAATWIEISPA